MECQFVGLVWFGSVQFFGFGLGWLFFSCFNTLFEYHHT